MATYLFPHKDVLIEVQLNLFVGGVDTKLLEAVLFEVLEAEYIQDTDDVVVTPVPEIIDFTSKSKLRFFKR